MRYKYNRMEELENALKDIYDQADPEVVQNWLLGITQEVNKPKIHNVDGCHNCVFCERKVFSPKDDKPNVKFKPVCYWDGSESNLIDFVLRKSSPDSCPLNSRDILIKKSI